MEDQVPSGGHLTEGKRAHLDDVKKALTKGYGPPSITVKIDGYIVRPAIDDAAAVEATLRTGLLTVFDTEAEALEHWGRAPMQVAGRVWKTHQTRVWYGGREGVQLWVMPAAAAAKRDAPERKS